MIKYAKSWAEKLGAVCELRDNPNLKEDPTLPPILLATFEPQVVGETQLVTRKKNHGRS